MLFEMVLHDVFTYMTADELEIGFKRKFGCPSALFVLRQTINYFNERYSNIFIASLDASKAVVRVNHFKWFSSLIKK